MILDIFQYGFVVRGLIAGVMVGVIAPLIGIFLVLRRYSMIADTIAHVSLAGIAGALIFGIHPGIGAFLSALLASLGIERLRSGSRLYGESALALFLSGSLALAVVLLSFERGLSASVFSYLFGSILTVTVFDLYTILALGILVIGTLIFHFKEFLFISFDEEAAQVNGVRTRRINAVFMVLTACTVSLSLPVVGALLISALIVFPVVTALQLKKSFASTLFYAEAVSILSVISGIFLSFYFNLSTGGVIVLLMLLIFGAVLVFKRS